VSRDAPWGTCLWTMTGRIMGPLFTSDSLSQTIERCSTHERGLDRAPSASASIFSSNWPSGGKARLHGPGFAFSCDVEDFYL
jgi:hypothetical protein